MKYILITLTVLLSSCVTKPTKVVRVASDGTRTEMTSLGWSILSREKNVKTSMADSAGFTASYESTDTDSAAGLRAYLTAQVAKVGLKSFDNLANQHYGVENVKATGANAIGLKKVTDEGAVNILKATPIVE